MEIINNKNPIFDSINDFESKIFSSTKVINKEYLSDFMQIIQKYRVKKNSGKSILIIGFTKNGFKTKYYFNIKPELEKEIEILNIKYKINKDQINAFKCFFRNVKSE
ncbi:hypothetical protein NAT51_15305 [Flavobacterium amniphilum]|uniref:hypothetical protein n=1 Tax=Flavobacterium amniphilum TaxID=1834035 RepID=UPI00202AA298|nr:hypothetical protein [Flavobacterium amniphilum]MCL9806902.1 hypothetical protein [Flavobacterium amniphilum]